MAVALPFPSGQWIAYVGPFTFPEGSAAARRVLGISRSLADATENVVIASGAGQPRDLEPLGTKGADTRIWHGCLNEFDASWGHLRRARALLWEYGRGSVQWLATLQNRPKLVIVYGSFQPYLANVLAWCRRASIPCVADIVEWYAPSQYSAGRLNPLFWQGEYAMRSTLKGYNGIICISSLLENYYRSSCEVVRVPPTLDVGAAGAAAPAATDGRIRLIYAGLPQGKDLLGHAIEALAKLDPDGARVELCIVGPTENALKAAFPDLPRCVTALGRKGHAQTMDIVSRSDFSILLRPQMRYANAGFPTKVVESMSCGTPVICNLTSDLAMYIRDGEQGIICRDHSASAFAEAVERVLTYPRAKLREMREATWAAARSAFDYRVHTAPLTEFVARAARRHAGNREP